MSTRRSGSKLVADEVLQQWAWGRWGGVGGSYGSVPRVLPGPLHGTAYGVVATARD